MEPQDQGAVSFLGMNIILLGIIGIAIFGYFLLLIRKRWRQNFLHHGDRKKKDEKPL